MRSRRTSRRAMLASTTALCLATATNSAAGATRANTRPRSANRIETVGAESCSATARRNGRVATVDRIVDGARVVLLLEADGRVVDQLVVPREDLPAVEEGDRLSVTLDGDDIESACVLEDDVEKRRGRLRTWFRSLADRLA